jgi:hypothetical protein
MDPVFFSEFSLEHEKGLATVQGLFLLIRTKGMGEIFHGQTKGYMFVVNNFTYRIYHGNYDADNKFVFYFT